MGPTFMHMVTVACQKWRQDDPIRIRRIIEAALEEMESDLLDEANIDFHRAILKREQERYPDNVPTHLALRVAFEYGVSFARQYIRGALQGAPPPMTINIPGPGVYRIEANGDYAPMDPRADGTYMDTGIHLSQVREWDFGTKEFNPETGCWPKGACDEDGKLKPEWLAAHGFNLPEGATATSVTAEVDPLDSLLDEAAKNAPEGADEVRIYARDGYLLASRKVNL